MDNEADCGCVIRVGNPGRHRNNNDVRDDLHQDSENAGGDHMAYPTELKEILVFTVKATDDEIVEIEMALTSLGVYFERKDV